MAAPISAPLSVVHGIPLDEEEGVGALTMPGFLREIVERHGAREALIRYTPEGVVRWSYDEFWRRAQDVARALIAADVGKGARVGILMTNRPELLASVFGVAMTGAVTVILSTFSTQPELEHLVQVSGVSTLLFEPQVLKKDFAAILLDLEPQLRSAEPGQLVSTKFPYLRRVVSIDAAPDAKAIQSWDDFLKAGETVPVAVVEARAAEVKPADPGALFFSSGSTGMPKGILHAHRAIALQWWRWPRMFAMTGELRCWTANGFFWSGQFSMVLGTALSTGGCVVLQSSFDAEEALRLIEKERVSAPFASPHQWERMAAAPNYLQTDLSSIRYIDDRAALARHPSVTVKWRLPPSYGTTETLAINCCYSLYKPALEPGGHGEPLPGVTIKIFDPLTGEIVPRGQRGEIGVKGATLMLGYIGKVPEDVFDADGYYRTGDGGYVTEGGWLYFEGRLTDIIKTGGANVSPLEIDAAIRTNPQVKITQTVGVPHPTLGEIVVACVVLHDHATLDEAGLRAHLKDLLASYKIPRRVLFFRDEEVAMTGSSKVKAGALREIAAARLAGSDAVAPTG